MNRKQEIRTTVISGILWSTVIIIIIYLLDNIFSEKWERELGISDGIRGISAAQHNSYYVIHNTSLRFAIHNCNTNDPVLYYI